MPAVVVAGGRFDGQIDESQLFVDRHLGPDTGVPRVIGGAVQPAVVSRLAFLRNSVKGPETLARSNVEAPNVAFVVLETLRRGAFAERRTDDDHVSADDGRALESDFAGDEIRQDGLVDVRLELGSALDAEGRNSRAGLRVERDEAVAGRDVEDSLFAPVGPVREAASGELSGRRGAARPLVLPMYPLLGTGDRVECDHG